jgi:hypothetical protein
MDQDQQFFLEHPDRRARIRTPSREPYINRQRAVEYLSEEELSFRRLGPHDKKRRRIIVYRTPGDHPTHANHLLKIPLLQFADEAIADDDRTLLTIVHELMVKEAMK